MAAIAVQIDQDRLISRLFWALVAMEFLLFLADIFINRYELVPVGAIQRLVNITREDGIPNWFSSTQMLVVGVVLALTSFAVKKNPAAGAKKWLGWAVIAAFFLFMGFDDGTKFHERMGTAFQDFSRQWTWLQAISDSYPSYSWQMLFGPLFAGMGLFILVFLWQELDDKSLRKNLLRALGLYAAAVLLDFFEGVEKYAVLEWNPYEGLSLLFATTTKSVRHYSKLVEEIIEMFGSTLFLVIFLRNFFQQAPSWQIGITAQEGPPQTSKPV